MAFSKNHLYPKETQLVSEFSKAFAHSARIKIVEHLTQYGPCSVEELMKTHPLSQPAMSNHLEKLRKNHLVLYAEEHPRIIYWVDSKTIKLVKKYLRGFLKRI